MDWNVDPLCSVLFQIHKDNPNIRIFKTYSLSHAGEGDLLTQRMCETIKQEYPNNIYYAYPDSQSTDSINFSELYLGLSKNSISFTYYLLVNGPNKAKFGNDSYFNLSYAKGIIQGFEFISSVGYYTGKTMVSGNQTDFMVGLTKKGFTLSALATNTTIKQPRMQIKYELDIF